MTERILQALPQDVTEDNRSLIVDSLSTLIADEAVKNDTLLRAVVSSFYAGNEYYLSVYKDYYDVRLVYAPALFGWQVSGEIPITGFGRGIPETFPVFRIYADTHNEPAAYSKDNVPYHPDYYAPISLAGYKEGSFLYDDGLSRDYQPLFIFLWCGRTYECR